MPSFAIALGYLRNTKLIYDAASLAFFTAAGITDNTQKEAIDKLVRELKGNNSFNTSIWDKIKALYPEVGGTSAAHAVNLKSPGTFDRVWANMNAGDFSYYGTNYNGTTQYGNTQLTPSTSLTLNSTSLFYYSREQEASGGKVEMGANDVGFTNPFLLSIRNTSDTFYSDMYNQTAGQGTATFTNTDSRGFYIASRTASNSHVVYKDGTLKVTSTTSGGALTARPIWTGALNFDNVYAVGSSKLCMLSGIGDGLTANEISILDTAAYNYQSYLGRELRITNFMGDSLTLGTGASPSSSRWTSVLCGLRGIYDENNLGVGGQTVSQGTDNPVTLSNIPAYDGRNTKYLFMTWGVNDCWKAGTDAATFETDYTAAINYAVNTKGYPISKIILTSDWFTLDTGSNATITKYIPFRQKIADVATATGARFIDFYTYGVSNGSSSWMDADGVHMNNTGYLAKANYIHSLL